MVWMVPKPALAAGTLPLREKSQCGSRKLPNEPQVTENEVGQSRAKPCIHAYNPPSHLPKTSSPSSRPHPAAVLTLHPSTPSSRPHPAAVLTLQPSTPCSQPHPAAVHTLQPLTSCSRPHPSAVHTLQPSSPCSRPHPAAVQTLQPSTPCTLKWDS